MAMQRAYHQRKLADLIQSDCKNHSVRSHRLGLGGVMDSMAEDIDDNWLYESTPPSCMYPKRRVFIYKGCVSLWHKHPLDDHLTYQIRGSKDFVLLDPTQSERINDINRNELYSFGFDIDKYPKWRGIRPISARLNAGDAIYIPPLWWHTVVPVDQQLGVTLASTWGSSRKAIFQQGLPNLLIEGNRMPARWFLYLSLYALTGWRKFLDQAMGKRRGRRVVAKKNNA